MSDVFYMYYAYYLSPIFAEIPTYPQIGRPLWTFPKDIPRRQQSRTFAEDLSLMYRSKTAVLSNYAHQNLALKSWKLHLF